MVTDVRKNMKAEINKENKSKFFALYWGQPIIEMVSYEDLINPYVAHFRNDGVKRKLETVINLKPLSQITDDDAIEVALMSGCTKENSIPFLISYGKKSVNEWETRFNSDVIDFLRYKGYAVNWMGLSVDEMVGSGWIKLIQ